jgi:transcriptional regulator with XRE-family HTH domain
MSQGTPDSPRPPLTQDAMRAEFCAIRKELHLTQKAYGEALGCDHNTVSRYEHGRLHVPRPVLTLARTLLDRPKEVLTVTRTRKSRIPESRLTSAAFVLVRVLPDDTRCWHAPESVEDILADDATPCKGKRLHFVALLPPTKRVEKRRTETITCEQHAYTALYWLQKQYQGWLAPVIRKAGARWFQHWRATLRRMGEEAKNPPRDAYAPKRPRGRPKKVKETACP